MAADPHAEARLNKASAIIKCYRFFSNSQNSART
jgi:hypothetical protein